MKAADAKIRMDYHRPNKKNTLRSYESVITPFCRGPGNQELDEPAVDRVPGVSKKPSPSAAGLSNSIQSLILPCLPSFVFRYSTQTRIFADSVNFSG